MNGSVSPAVEFPRFEPWRFIIYMSMVVFEVCWIVPWFVLLPAEKQVLPSGIVALVFGSISSISLLAFRMEADLEIRRDLRPWVTAGLIILSLLFAIKALVYPFMGLTVAGMLEHIGSAISSDQPGVPLEFYVFLFVFLLVYRASALAKGGVDPSAVFDHLRLGLLMSFGAGLLSALSGKVVAGQMFFLASFLFTGLIGMTAARITVLGRLRGGQSISFDRRRLLAILASTGIFVLAAFGLALILSSPVGIRLLSGIGTVFQVLFAGFIALIGLLLTPLLVLIVYLFSAIAAGIRRIPQPNPTQSMEDALRRWEELIGRQATVPNPAVRPILLWGTILVIFIILLFVVRARVVRRQESGMQEAESLLSGEDLLRKIWKDLLGFPDRLAQMGGLRRAQRRRYAARIREIYADLLNLAASLDAVRPVSQTPLEYLPVLQSVFPDCQADLEAITEAYLRVRYGEYPETSQQVVQIESAWKRLETSSKEINQRSRRKR